MYPSDKRQRQYASGAHKRREKKMKLETAVAGTRHIEQFFSSSATQSVVTEESGETGDDYSNSVDDLSQPGPGLAPSDVSQSDLNSTVPMLLAPVEAIDETSSKSNLPFTVLDMSKDYPTDRANFPSTLSDELRHLILAYGACRPKGPFPVSEEFGRRVFSEKHYVTYSVGSEMQIERSWLCFSPAMQKPYCQCCWLFRNPASQQREWADGVPGNPMNYGEKIKSHEKTEAHRAASSAFARWKAGCRMDQENENIRRTEVNFWRQVLIRITNIVMTLAVMSLAFRGHREHSSADTCEGGNFLALVAMQARFDPILQDLLHTPAKKVRYLSPMIQNELIQLISNVLRNRLISQIQACPFYTIIVDTTSDITRTDQVSIVVRHVCIEREVVSIKETFLGFVPTRDSTAVGLTTIISEWLLEHDLDLCKIRGQGYDGASVMSGKIGGVQKVFADVVKSHGVNVPVPFVHCASHNLNLVINDAAEATVEGIGFFGTLATLYNFFGRSLNRWATLGLAAEGVQKLTLKKLCTTRWSSRIDAVRAVKNRYSEILKVLVGITLTSKDRKELTEAAGLIKCIETFNFIVCITIWERILTCLHRVSNKLQAVNIDLSASVRLLSAARSELQCLRASWESVLMSATAMSSVWGIKPEFKISRQRRVKVFHDELSSDCRLTDPMHAFQVDVFYKLVDVAINQLKWRFEGQHQVAELFSFLFPDILLRLTDTELEAQAVNLQKAYASDFGEDLVSELRSFRQEFKKELEDCSTVQDVLELLVTSHMISSMPELGTACVLFCTLPVTVASAERSFSKLKLIKSYLRSTLSQERLDSLALIAIENKAARELDLDALVDRFAELKARKKQF